MSLFDAGRVLYHIILYYPLDVLLGMVFIVEKGLSEPSSNSE